MANLPCILFNTHFLIDEDKKKVLYAENLIIKTWIHSSFLFITSSIITYQDPL